jgi:high-affinity iron transporter
VLPAMLLSLREGLEIALIVGIVFGAVHKLGRNELARPVWLGLLAATLASLGVALGLQGIGAELEEPYAELFEGAMMVTAAAVLTWMIFWMQSQARYLKANIENEVRLKSLKGGQRGVFFLAFALVAREGIELALFLSAVALSVGRIPAAFGALAGLSIAALLGWGLFAATLRLNLRRFFQVTSVLLILFAAGLAAHGMHEFVETGLIPGLIDPLWDTSAILAEDSIPGTFLKTLFGYNANPSLTEGLTYLAYLAAVVFGLWRSRAAVQVSKNTAA